MHNDSVSGLPSGNRREKWRHWVQLLIITLCLAGAAAVAVVIFQHTSHDVSVSSGLVLRGIILFLIAVIAGLDLFFPKGHSPKV
jgi:hypothetical protein